MKASLVWPAYEDFSGLDTTWLPQGVCHLATEANKRGHEVDILDGRVLKAEGVKRALAMTKSEVVGISILSSLMGFAEETVDYIQKNRPDIKIALGGIHPTVTTDCDNWNCEWVVKGEGEVTFRKILDGEIPGGIVHGETPDLATLAPIDRSLISVEEKPLPELEEPFATVIIGRGCPYNCTFCQPAERSLFGARLRHRPVENVVTELKSLGVKSFMVHDDCFTSMKSYVSDFCEVITPLGLTWWCQGRADNVCEHIDLVRRMRNAGLRGMILGHESGDDRVLAGINKGVTVAENVEATRILKALGIIVWSNIMVGLPVDIEPPSAIINTMMMTEIMKPEIISLAVFTPHPGSRLYDDCEAKGIILRRPDDWTYFNRGHFEPKIAGPDYDFLAWAAGRIMEGRK